MSTPSIALQHPTRVRVRSQLFAPLILISLALLTRLPFQGQLLYHWDSVNFAFALRHFDVAQGQPHAPGYLLYVWLGRATAWLTGSAQAGLVLIAISASALAAVALYDLGRRMWDVRTGWFAALLLLSSPLFWFYGEVALPHTLDALMVIGVALLSWRVWHGEYRVALLLALWLGLAGGLRQQTLVFMFPLAAVACLRLPWRWKLGAGAVLAGTVLAWLIPLFALNGGIERYLSVIRTYSSEFNRTTSIFSGAGLDGVRYNTDKLVRYTLWGWALGLVPLLVVLPLLWRRAASLPQLPREVALRLPASPGAVRAWLLLLWGAPALAFYSLIHMGQQGLIFVYLPILLLLSGRAAALLSARWRWGGVLVAACVVGNSLLFLHAPAHLLDGRVKVLSYATVREHDALLRAQLATLENLPPGTALLADEWRFPQYYAPQVSLVRFRREDHDPSPLAPSLQPLDASRIERATALAWYEPELDRFDLSGGRTTLVPGNAGVQLRILSRTENERFVVTSHGFRIVPGAN